jgi:hypothetical protein
VDGTLRVGRRDVVAQVATPWVEALTYVCTLCGVEVELVTVVSRLWAHDLTYMGTLWHGQKDEVGA